MNDIEVWADRISAQWQKERSYSQMTLGEIIHALEKIDPSKTIKMKSAHSYRGYYVDLAFEPEEQTVGDLLIECNGLMGKELCGYRGGDFVMVEATPVWCAYYGCLGLKVIDINQDGRIKKQRDDDD